MTEGVGESLELRVVPTPLAICKLPAAADIPPWAVEAPFLIAVRTPDELTLVCSDRRVPDVTKAERGLRAIAVKGATDHTATGVLASLVDPLAAAEVPIFAASTYTTDYVLVPGDRLEHSIDALTGAGHSVER